MWCCAGISLGSSERFACVVLLLLVETYISWEIAKSSDGQETPLHRTVCQILSPAEIAGSCWQALNHSAILSGTRVHFREYVLSYLS